jgi:O-antigen/teichoic acid export membrane protein
VFTMSAAAINIGTIYLLVPYEGILGAAEASAAGYFALLVLISIYGRTIKIGASIAWRQLVPMSIAASVTFVIGVVLLPGTGITGIASRGALLMTLPLTLPLSAGVSPSDLLALRQKLGRRVRPT